MLARLGTLTSPLSYRYTKGTKHLAVYMWIELRVYGVYGNARSSYVMAYGNMRML